MATDVLPLPPREAMVRHVCIALSRYWPGKSSEVQALPVPAADIICVNGPLTLRAVVLPDWAKEWGIDGQILVPAEACVSGMEWQRVDWWAAAFLLLECWHERVWEFQHGPIHSYGYKLHGWDVRAWDHAWVNRIALFLRAWTAHAEGKSADERFGELPKAEVSITHDVDAIRKTLPIRIKQCLFNLFNAQRHLLKGEIRESAKKATAAARFLLGNENWWTLDRLLAMEARAGLRATFNFYADVRQKSLKSWLFDPGYNIDTQRINRLFEQIGQQQGTVGLHPTYDAWDSSPTIAKQKAHLERISGHHVTACRQHWLRFSWNRTWSAQVLAGLKNDMTLMFNDRPGFRASAAIAWMPWDKESGRTHNLTELPTVMMDSHFYDYQTMDRYQRTSSMRHWLNEVRAVHGEIAVLWHPHTLTRDYGWTAGFQELIGAINEIQECPHLQ